MKTSRENILITMVAGWSMSLWAAEPSKLPKRVDLGADKCIPCKAMAPMLKELKTAYTGRMDVEFIDVWKNPDAGKAHKIKLIPTGGEVGVPIFQKSTSPERLVCYCFGLTVAAIQREVGATGTSRIATDIKTKCAQGLDDCVRTNPQGRCCLGNVQRVIREASGDKRQLPADGGGCCCH